MSSPTCSVAVLDGPGQEESIAAGRFIAPRFLPGLPQAKHLAAKASWDTANACLQFHGGFGFAYEYGEERDFRETRFQQVAPISTSLILSHIAEHVLGLPRSY